MSKNILSFDELVSKLVQRTMVHTVTGLGDVVLHELSGSEAITLREEASTKNSEIDPNSDQLASSEVEELFLAKWAARFLLGVMPTDEQIEKLRLAKSPKIISNIYIAGCGFNITEETQKEALEKNLPGTQS